MYAQLKCVVVDQDTENRQEMSAFLLNCGVQVVGHFQMVEQLVNLLGTAECPQLVVVNLDPNPQETLGKTGQLARQFPTTSFLVLSKTVDPKLLLEAMHSGIREFVPVPIDQDMFSGCVERVAKAHGMGRRARLIHMIPTIGGCGSTTVSCNVAASLAQQSRTTLLDLDLVRGEAAASFDLHPRYTIADVADSHEQLDAQLLENALTVHQKSGLSVLARPDKVEDTQRVHQAGFARLLGLLGRMFDNVVMDSVMSIDPLYAAAIQQADMNVLVMQLNVPSAKNAERFLGVLRRMGIDATKICVVVNRFVKKGWDIAPEEVEKALGLQIAWSIPNDFKNAIAAINFGEPVVLRTPKAEMSTSLMDLAVILSGNAVKN